MSVTYILIAFFGMLAMMLLGMPIAVAMAAIGIGGGLLAYGAPFINSIVPVVWGVHNDNLLSCIPLFVLMGELLLRSGIADRMFGALAAWLAVSVVQDSRSYQSVSQTPWATPLAYPQTAWLIGLIVFALVAVVYALRATWLLARGQITAMNHEFGPRSTKEEVDEELEDLKARSSGADAPASAAIPGART